MFDSKETAPESTIQKETKIVTPRESHAGTLLVVLLLALAVAGTSWYTDRRQEEQGAELTRLPGLQTSLDGLKSRVGAAEDSLRFAGDRWSTVDERLAKIENRAGNVLTSAKNKTEKLMIDLEARVDSRLQQIDQETTMIKTRMDQVESNNRFQRAELERVRHELADSQHEVADLRQDTSQDIRDVRASNDEASNQLDGRLGELERDHRDQRVDFEISKDRSQHLLPGVTVSVESTDPVHQRYNGWVWLLQDRRTVWVRNQPAQVPVMMYPKAGGAPLRLVVNQVNGRDVTGYLLVPESQAAFGQAASVLSGGN
jgi:hypothetical protein